MCVSGTMNTLVVVVLTCFMPVFMQSTAIA